MIIHLISSPRTISTSLMYSFDNRTDMCGLDEPYYAYYLKKTGKPHPGRDLVLKEMSSEPNDIRAHIYHLAEKHRHLFVKNMAHHIGDLSIEDFLGYKHIILIRNPARVIISLSKVLTNLELLDIAVQDQWHFFNVLIERGEEVIVVNSTNILKNPEKQLKQLCSVLDIPFEDRMLKWDAGARPIDGSWAPHYYNRTHASSGFDPFKEEPFFLPKSYQRLYDSAKEYFNQLNQYAI